MRLRIQEWLVFLGAAACLLSGCATSALWEEGRFARYHEPANPSQLRLFQSSQGQDVLVEYVESREDNGATRRCAYWLRPNVERLQNRQIPRFVSLERKQGLAAIPVLRSPPALDGFLPAGLYAGLYAVASTNENGFTLYSASKELGSYELPVYRDGSGRTKQMLLTPLTVTADVTIIGGFLAVYFSPWLLPGLSCAVH